MKELRIHCISQRRRQKRAPHGNSARNTLRITQEQTARLGVLHRNKRHVLVSYRKSREGLCRTLKPQECTVKKSRPKLFYIFIHFLMPSRPRAHNSTHTHQAPSSGRKAREQQAYRLRGELGERFAVAAATNVIVSHVNETLQCHVRHTVVQHCLALEVKHFSQSGLSSFLFLFFFSLSFLFFLFSLLTSMCQKMTFPT